MRALKKCLTLLARCGWGPRKMGAFCGDPRPASGVTRARRNASMRGFIALTLPPHTRDALGVCQAQLRQRIGDGVRWTPVDQLHITLRFLGSFDTARVNALLALVQRVADNARPIEAAWSPAVGAFPGPVAPRVLWVGLQQGADAVSAVARDIEAGVVALGFAAEEHAFHPHVTLGRVRSPVEAIQVGQRLRGGQMQPGETDFRLETIAFIESVLTPEGAVHTLIGETPLAG